MLLSSLRVGMVALLSKANRTLTNSCLTRLRRLFQSLTARKYTGEYYLSTITSAVLIDLL